MDEVDELEDTVRRLEIKSSDAEERLRDLQHTRLALEKEIDVKRNSLSIDRDRCLKVRSMFPSTNLLCGYRNASALNWKGEEEIVFCAYKYSCTVRMEVKSQ